MVVASRVCKLVAVVALVDGNLSDRPSFDGVEVRIDAAWGRCAERSRDAKP